MTSLTFDVSDDLIAALDELASGVGATRAGVAREMLELGIALMAPGSHMSPVPGVAGAFQPMILEK